MNRPRLLAPAIVLLLMTTPSPVLGERVVLIEQGEPKALIVLPAGAGPRSVEAGAARILSDHLFLVSGVRLAVQREDELGAVTVEDGRLAFRRSDVQVPDNFVLVGEGEASRRMGLTGDGLGPGGILVKTTGNVLALLGPDAASDNAGTRHAVIEFLESIGVRYLWPGATGRVIPKLETVAAGPIEFRFACW